MNRYRRRRRARLRRFAVTSLVVVIVALWTGGLFLPSRHVELATAQLPASPETVWMLLTDLDGMPAWRQDVEALERLPNGSGLVRWREVDRRGRAAALERVEAIPPVRLVVRPASALEQRRRWIYHLVPSAGGTTLSIEEERRIDNPFIRAVVGLVGGDRGRIDRLSADLEERLADRRHHLAAVER